MSTVVCPKCKHEFSADEALTHKIEETLRQKYETEAQELRKKSLEWREEQEKLIVEKEKELKASLEEKIKKELASEASKELQLLQEENLKNKQELDKAREQEMELRKKARELDDKMQALEIEKQRQLDEERLKIRETAEKRVKDEFQLTLAEQKKINEDLLKQLEEMKKKATQGSQQLQGEILELELEEILKSEFPVDDILPVAKGMTGADVMQKVRDHNGRECGTIIWESKRTKDWQEGWVAKLKTDMRSSKSDLAILVSTQLPKDITNFGPKDGIMVTNFENFLPVAKIMRHKLIELCYAKMSVEGKNDKKEILWNYLTGNEFKQRVEAIVEAFNLMKDGLEKEKLYFAKKWSQQEKLIDVVLNQTVGMHGDLQGLVGSSLPQIKSLEMDNFELIEAEEVVMTDQTKTVIHTDTIIQTDFGELLAEKPAES